MVDDKIDVGAARKLVDEISADLAKLPEDSARHQELRSEVEALRATLAGTAPPAQLQDSIRSVHMSLDRAAVELRADGIRAGVFLAEIGRILGLD